MGLNMAPMRTRESAEQQTVQRRPSLAPPISPRCAPLPADEANTNCRRQGMIIDGWIVPEDLSLTFDAGRQNAVDVLVGSTATKGRSRRFRPAGDAQSWTEGAAQRWGELAELGLAAIPPPAMRSQRITAAEASPTHGLVDASFRGEAAPDRAQGVCLPLRAGTEVPPTARATSALCHGLRDSYVFNHLGTPSRVIPMAARRNWRCLARRRAGGRYDVVVLDQLREDRRSEWRGSARNGRCSTMSRRDRVSTSVSRRQSVIRSARTRLHCMKRCMPANEYRITTITSFQRS